MNAYQQRLKIKRDNYNHDQYILQQGIELERAKADEEKKEILHQMARKLKIKGMLVSEIAELTNLSMKEIQAL